MKNTKKMSLKRETVRVMSGTQLKQVAGGVTTAPSPSWVYSCVVSCTFTSDCTTSTTF